MTLEEAAQFLHGANWLRSRPGLGRMTELLRLLGDPQRDLKFIHVAGSNGKGSVCAMLASILTQAGYRTGLYTSPHLLCANERMKVNGADLSDEALLALTETLLPAVAGMADRPTEFELLTAMAFLHFRRQCCEIVVLEVGLGGRLDATNVIPAPEAAVITGISLEHTAILGDTVAQIAGEKAGILKPGTAAVLSAQGPEAEAVVRERCRALGGTLTVTRPDLIRLTHFDLGGQTFSYRNREALRLRLAGTYQVQNAAAVLDTADCLIRRGWRISEQALRDGLAAAAWPGRFEVLRQSPPVLVDGAHNPDGVRELARCLDRYFPGKQLIFVMGVMADKDYGSMLRILAPYVWTFIAVTPPSDRALPSAELRRVMAETLPAPAYDAGSVEGGVALALRLSGPDTPVCIFGSLYQAGEARALFAE